MSYITKIRSIIQNKLALKTTSATAAPSGGVLVTALSGNFSTNSATYVDITNLTGTLVTTGRPVIAMLSTDPAGVQQGLAGFASTSSSNLSGFYGLVRDGTTVQQSGFNSTIGTASAPVVRIPSSSVWWMDFPTAGTHTYKVQAKTSNSAFTVYAQFVSLVVWEI